MIKVQIYNDGKEDLFSYESSLSYMPELSSFGKPTEEEAVQVLKSEVKKRIKQLQAIDWDSVVPIDGMGNVKII